MKTLELLLRIFAAKNWHPHRLETPHEGGAMVSGAAGGDRTHDPWLRRPILYPLSYSRNAELIVVVRQTADEFGDD